MEILNSLSIIPSYNCNFHCKYCYLGKLTYQKDILSLDVIQNRLYEIKTKYNIDRVILFGGEISILNKDYIESLYNLVKDYTVTFVTNLSQDWFINYCLAKNVSLSVSLNEERPEYKRTLQKLKALKGLKNICLSVVVLPSLLCKTPKEILDFFEELGHNVIFIQYHPSIYCDVNYKILTKDYSTFLVNLLKEKHKHSYHFKIENETILNDDTYKSTSDNFLFLNPNGKYSVVQYTPEEKEYYLEFSTLEEWESFCKNEKTWYKQNCENCKYFGKCKAEHLVNLNQNNCSGLFNLIEEYQKIK